MVLFFQTMIPTSLAGILSRCPGLTATDNPFNFVFISASSCSGFRDTNRRLLFDASGSYSESNSFFLFHC
ncbi:hypothetical protein M413DRAFT_283971 [Hebeloma cylindrosporum]|uniref:Uncharacterized protein n=1 Tax=Hebeloma cylindrosporum TaxID=76867 RepID=A0A0C2Y6W1_HEBCY|nr:hypothetical protein M413DRAFT_283971 [Hebeloma cylindrosporum h7]